MAQAIKSFEARQFQASTMMNCDHSVRFCYAEAGKGDGKEGGKLCGQPGIGKARGKGYGKGSGKVTSKGSSNDSHKGSFERVSKGYNTGGKLRSGMSTGNKNQILRSHNTHISKLGKEHQW